MSEDELMTKKEMTQYLKISPANLDRLVSKKQIPHIKLGKRVLFRKSDIDDWLKSKEIK